MNQFFIALFCVYEQRVHDLKIEIICNQVLLFMKSNIDDNLEHQQFSHAKSIRVQEVGLSKPRCSQFLTIFLVNTSWRV